MDNENDFNRSARNCTETYFDRLGSDADDIRQFILERTVTHGKPLSDGRVRKVLFSLSKVRELAGKPFPEWVKKDLVTAIASINNSGMKLNTRRDILAALKPFLKWMRDEGKTSLSSDLIASIKIPPPPREKIKADALLTQDEIDAILKAASPRDRAIIALMADGGLRPIEAGGIRRDQVEFSNGTMYVIVNAKTKKERRIPCPVAQYYVQRWLDNAPYPIGEKDPLFRSSRMTDGVYSPLKDDALRWCIREAARKAGVTKYRNPYQFRHGAITRWINAGVSTAKVAVFSHGGPSRMIEEVYWHPDQAEVAGEIMQKVHGRGVVEKMQVPTTRMCGNCGRVFPMSVMFCDGCGQPLTKAAGDQVHQERQQIRAAGAEYVRAEDVERIVAAAVKAALKK